jgi:hypothetical protein
MKALNRSWKNSLAATAAGLTPLLVWPTPAHAQDAVHPAAKHAPPPETAAPSKDGTEPSKDGTEPSKDDTEERLRVGALVGVGFPRPLAIEPMVKIGQFMAFGAEYGVLPTVTIRGVNASMWSLAVDARVFPFGGQFFVGLRAGRQHIDGGGLIAVSSYGSAVEELALDSWFLNPRLGVLWTSDIGITVGIDAGLQIPVSATTTSSLPLSIVPGAKGAADSIGGAVLPTVDLLRVGLLL